MIREKLNGLIAEAMKSHDETALRTYRFIKTEFTNAEKSGNEFTDATEMKILQKMAAQRKDAIEQYKNAGRAELAEKEQAELDIISTFLPKEPTERDITDIVRDYIKLYNETVSMKDMKPILTKAQETYPTVNGKLVSTVLNKFIKGELS